MNTDISTSTNNQEIKKLIKNYPDFPKKGIIYKDILPVLMNPEAFKSLIERMASTNICKESDAIIGIDARGFLFASGIALKLDKPMIVARKPDKLPGQLYTKAYKLEYGKSSLSIQKDALINFKRLAIIDDLLATGGTVESVSDILSSEKKQITGLCVVIELSHLKGREKLPFKVSSQIKY